MLREFLAGSSLTVLDVGGRGGFGMIPKLHPYIDLFSFEPDPVSLEPLKRMYAGNSSFKSVTISPLALSDHAGESVFHQALHPSMSSLLPPDPERFLESFGDVRRGTDWNESMRTVKSITVKTERIDAFAAAHQLATIDLLKLDTQGSELRILKGAESLLREKRIGMIFTEIQLLPLYKEQAVFSEIDLYLRGLGYRFIDLRVYPEAIERHNSWRPGLYEEPKYAMGGDAIYVPDFSNGLTGIAPERIALLLAAFGYLSDSRHYFSTYCGKNEKEIAAIFHEAARPGFVKQLKKLALRWVPPALARMLGKISG